MSKTETIEIKKTNQGALIEFGPRIVFVRRNPNENYKMTTVRFMSTLKGKSTNNPSQEELWSPHAWPSSACYMEYDNLVESGFGVIIYMYIMFGNESPHPDELPENAVLEAKEFAFRLHRMIENGFADGI